MADLTASMKKIKITEPAWENSQRKLDALPAKAEPTISADISRPIGRADMRKNPKIKPMRAKIRKSPVSAKK